MRVLEKYLQKVEAKLIAIHAVRDVTYGHERNQRLNRMRDPELNRETHCSTCGLPKDKHVEHEPPNVPKPEGPACPAEWRPFLQAQNEHYRSGLQALTDGELSGMPLPISERRLRTIAEEVKARLDKAAPSRYDRLGADDDWL